MARGLLAPNAANAAGEPYFIASHCTGMVGDVWQGQIANTHTVLWPDWSGPTNDARNPGPFLQDLLEQGAFPAAMDVPQRRQPIRGFQGWSPPTRPKPVARGEHNETTQHPEALCDNRFGACLV
jgi:hypothetical protein